MPISKEEYFKKPEETVEQYNSRIDSLRGDTSTINSLNIAPASELPFVSPTNNPIPNISGLEGYTPTPQETKEQGVSDQLQQLNLMLTGESAYASQQKEALGISAIQTTQADLTSQLTRLKNQSLDLQNQYNYTIPNQAQVNAEGRGITAQGLAPLTASELRKNQIQQGGIASQALIISANLDAVNGQLASANQKVLDAVEAKFGPQKALYDALTKNLELIKNDPSTTLQEKKRADAQQAILDAKKKKTDDEEAQQKAIWDMATTAATNGADSITLNKIQQAKTKQEALKIAADAGIFIEKQTEAQKLDLQLKQLQIQKAQQDLNPKTEPGKVVKINGVDYIQDSEGNLSVPNVPTTPIGMVDTTTEDKTISTLNTLIAKGSGILEAVGPSGSSLLSRSGLGNFTGKRQSFIGAVEQIVKDLTLEKLIEAKKQGATFGALSDREMDILAGAATKIGTWKIIDKKTGQVTGYNIDEPTFRAELQVIKDMAQKDKDLKMGKSVTNNYLDNLVIPLLNSTENAYSSAGYLQ